jgi:polyisoprenoid-binding protein YceI
MIRTRTIALLGAGAFATGLLLGLAPSRAETTVQPASSAAYTVDPVHSSIAFRIRHNGVANFYARFNEASGDFTLEDGGAVNVAVNTESVNTGNAKRDGHLKSPDFFNVKQFPEITFKSTSLEKTGEDTFRLSGDLTMVGKNRQIQTELTKIGERETNQGNLAGFEIVVDIKRSDFDMTYGIENGALGDDVRLYISLEGRQR